MPSEQHYLGNFNTDGSKKNSDFVYPKMLTTFSTGIGILLCSMIDDSSETSDMTHEHSAKSATARVNSELLERIACTVQLLYINCSLHVLMYRMQNAFVHVRVVQNANTRHEYIAL